MDTNLVEENKKPNMIKPAMNFGFIIGVILISYSVLTWALNMMFVTYMSIVNYVLIMVCLYLFAKKYRDEFNNGYISYGKAFGFIALSLLFVSFLVAFYNFVLFNYLDPSLKDIILENMRIKMIENNPELSEEVVDKAIDFQKNIMMNPFISSISYFFGNYLIGIIISLITSIFVMKKNKLIDDSSIQQSLN